MTRAGWLDGYMDIQSIGRPGGDMLYIMTAPVLTDVFCPEVGWTVARDGFCYDCGATDHEARA